MTRKKQINKAAEQFLADRPKGYFNTKSESNTALTGFIMGAKWADKNPNSPWISIKDRLPENGEMVFTHSVIKTEGVGECFEDKQFLVQRFIGKWISDNHEQLILKGITFNATHNVTHWMPIPQIEKGE